MPWRYRPPSRRFTPKARGVQIAYSMSITSEISLATFRNSCPRDEIDAGHRWMIERKEVHAMRTISVIRSMFFALFLLCLSASSYAQVSIGISVGYPPPPLPVYEQPICPEEGYIWTPGYWAWDGDDYFWVPGTWVPPPEPGFFWTPAYWRWRCAVFLFPVGSW